MLLGQATTQGQVLLSITLTPSSSACCLLTRALLLLGVYNVAKVFTKSARKEPLGFVSIDLIL